MGAVTWPTDSATLDSVRTLDEDAARDHRDVVDASFMQRDLHLLLTHGLAAASRGSCDVVPLASDRDTYAIKPEEDTVSPPKCFRPGCNVRMSTASGGSSGERCRTGGNSLRSAEVAKAQSPSLLSPAFAQYLKRYPEEAAQPLATAHEVRACVRLRRAAPPHTWTLLAVTVGVG